MAVLHASCGQIENNVTVHRLSNWVQGHRRSGEKVSGTDEQGEKEVTESILIWMDGCLVKPVHRMMGLAHDHHLDEGFRFVANVANPCCCHILNYIETRVGKKLPIGLWKERGEMPGMHNPPRRKLLRCAFAD